MRNKKLGYKTYRLMAAMIQYRLISFSSPARFWMKPYEFLMKPREF